MFQNGHGCSFAGVPLLGCFREKILTLQKICITIAVIYIVGIFVICKAIVFDYTDHHGVKYEHIRHAKKNIGNRQTGIFAERF